jgi:hypothetical protein
MADEIPETTEIKLGKKLWQEDDVNYPDKVRLNAAYEKLFGVHYDSVEKEIIADLGDVIYTCTPHAIVCVSFDGDSIYEKPTINIVSSQSPGAIAKPSAGPFIADSNSVRRDVSGRPCVAIVYDPDNPAKERGNPVIHATAARIAACLNACEGWDDPAALRRCGDAFKVVMEQCRAHGVDVAGGPAETRTPARRRHRWASLRRACTRRLMTGGSRRRQEAWAEIRRGFQGFGDCGGPLGQLKGAAQLWGLLRADCPRSAGRERFRPAGRNGLENEGCRQQKEMVEPPQFLNTKQVHDSISMPAVESCPMNENESHLDCRMPVEFVGGPLDGHIQSVVILAPYGYPCSPVETVMALIGRGKTLQRGQRVAVYKLTESGGSYQYRFQKEIIYVPQDCGG